MTTAPADHESPPTQTDATMIAVVLCDLDGVVWLAGRELPGAAEAVAALRATGRRVMFVTNNSAALVAEHEASLAAIGIPATGDVVTSAQAAAQLVVPDNAVAVVGREGINEAVELRGGRIVPLSASVADCVIVGRDPAFDFDRLTRASALVRGGARFIATNDDPTYPTPAGLAPGAGAVVAGIAVAAGAAPVIAGKPNEPMAQVVRERVGASFDPGTTLMVGDRWSTDGAFARQLGAPFALVRSAATLDDAPPVGAAAIEVDALVDVARHVIGDA